MDDDSEMWAALAKVKRASLAIHVLKVTQGILEAAFRMVISEMDINGRRSLIEEWEQRL